MERQRYADIGMEVEIFEIEIQIQIEMIEMRELQKETDTERVKRGMRK